MPIITKLKGALGNQMFQYAVARRISYTNKSPLKLSITHYDQRNDRQFALNCFRIRAGTASKEEIEMFKRLDICKVVDIFRPYYLRRIVYQRGSAFDPNILKITGHNVYLWGWWQSWKYFADISGVIKDEFIFKESIEDKYKHLVKQITSTESISLHLRRGDYLLPRQQKTWVVCSPNYYNQGLKRLEKLFQRANVFIFAEFPEELKWAKRNIQTKFPCTFVHRKSLGIDKSKDYEDMQLMSLCRHNIIANSTYSWWAAWLNKNPRKMVFAPKNWYVDPEENKICHRDLLPESWIRI